MSIDEWRFVFSTALILFVVIVQIPEKP